MLRFLFVAIMVVFSPFIQSAEYEACSIGTNSLIDYRCWDIKGINEEGFIYGTVFLNGKTIVFNSNTNHNLSFIDINAYSFPPKVVSNNIGDLFIRWENSSLPKPRTFLWSLTNGSQEITISPPRNSTGLFSFQPIAFNQLGQIIGRCILEGKEKACIWENGTITILNEESVLVKSLEQHGYHITKINLISINDKGEFSGFFEYGKYNEQKKTMVKIGEKPFFWNRSSAYIIDLPFEIKPYHLKKLNNNGDVLITNNNSSYIWNIFSGIEEIANFYAIDFNDSRTVLGGNANGDYSIWVNKKIISLSTLLGKDLKDLAPPFSDSYDIEKIHQVIGINNRGQIACLGTCWGEEHPCILTPLNQRAD